MKKTLKLMGLCALAVLALAGCKKEQPNNGKTSVKAAINQPTGNAKTGVAGLNLVWNSGDRIKVYSDDRSEVAEFTTTDNNVTEATFTTQTEMEVTDGFYAFYPADDVTYTGDNFVLALSDQQTGARNTFGADTYPMYATYASDKFTFHSPCALLAVAMNGTATIGSIVLTGAPDEKLNGNYTFNPEDMANPTLGETGSNTITLAFDNGLQLTDVNDTAYFALPAGVLANGFSVEFKGVDGGSLFTKTASANPNNTTVAQTILRMPAVTVNAAEPEPPFNPYTTPITFEAKDGDATVRFVPYKPALCRVEYSTDGGVTWEYHPSYTIPLTSGQKVSFRAQDTNANLASSKTLGSKFVCTGQCYVYGNIMSLLDKDNFATMTELNADFTFTHLFENNTSICNHPEKAFVLPMTTLKKYTYYQMFIGCANLTATPEMSFTALDEYSCQQMFSGCAGLTSASALMATTLSKYCYAEMFSGCTSLTTAPDMLVTAVAEYSCQKMFNGCNGLTTAPIVLSASTLADYCYDHMFYGCTSLTTPPTINAETMAKFSCYGMFDGCASLATAPQLNCMTLASGCYQNMFQNCTSLTTAPDLPATTLALGCYFAMFRYCSSLNSITCLATDLSASSCLNFWLTGVASTGTFHKAAGVTWPTGDNGIPSGWDVVEPAPSVSWTISAINCNPSYTMGGITATLAGDYSANEYSWVGDELNLGVTVLNGASVTFTSTIGNISKIEISFTTCDWSSALSSGWSLTSTGTTMTWTGTPSDTVTLTEDMLLAVHGITSIVFTLE